LGEEGWSRVFWRGGGGGGEVFYGFFFFLVGEGRAILGGWGGEVLLPASRHEKERNAASHRVPLSEKKIGGGRRGRRWRRRASVLGVERRSGKDGAFFAGKKEKTPVLEKGRVAGYALAKKSQLSGRKRPHRRPPGRVKRGT